MDFLKFQKYKEKTACNIEDLNNVCKHGKATILMSCNKKIQSLFSIGKIIRPKLKGITEV
jgi:hypothetical protein